MFENRLIGEVIGKSLMSCFLTHSLEKVPSVEDQCHTDRVATPMCTGLHRCRWPWPRHAARLVALACS